MPILNYTTKMGVDRTIQDITKALTKAKASAILTEYGNDGLPEKLSFRISVNGEPVHFKLPVDIDGVSRALKADKQYRDDAHARRVAWRILKDWIEAQMAIVQAQMATTDQVFLPYAQTNNGESVYERFQTNTQKYLA